MQNIKLGCLDLQKILTIKKSNTCGDLKMNQGNWFPFKFVKNESTWSSYIT